MADYTALGEHVKLQRGQSYKSALLGMDGPVLLGLGTIQRNGGFRGDNLRTYGGDTPARTRVNPGDFYVSLKDVTHSADLLGAVARVPISVPAGRLTQDTMRLDISESNIDRDYLYWALRAPNYRAYCRARGTGTTNLDLSQADFLAYRLRTPPLSEQRAIAEVLGALDDKIAANTNLATTSDELVRAWYMGTSASADSTATIAELATQPRALIAPSEFTKDLAYVGLEHVPRRQMWLSEFGPAESVTSTKTRFSKGDVLFGKLRPYFHKVAATPFDGVSSTDILVVRASDTLLKGFLLAALASDAVVERCAAASEGTRMPRTSWATLSSIEVPWPGEQAARAMSKQIDAVRDRVEAALAENRTLAATRDALLPALMSGTLRVRDAERVVESVL